MHPGKIAAQLGIDADDWLFQTFADVLDRPVVADILADVTHQYPAGQVRARAFAKALHAAAKSNTPVKARKKKIKQAQPMLRKGGRTEEDVLNEIDKVMRERRSML